MSSLAVEDRRAVVAVTKGGRSGSRSPLGAIEVVGGSPSSPQHQSRGAAGRSSPVSSLGKHPLAHIVRRSASAETNASRDVSSGGVCGASSPSAGGGILTTAGVSSDNTGNDASTEATLTSSSALAGGSSSPSAVNATTPPRPTPSLLGLIYPFPNSIGQLRRRIRRLVAHLIATNERVAAALLLTVDVLGLARVPANAPPTHEEGLAWREMQSDYEYDA